MRRRLAGLRFADRSAALAVPGLGDQDLADFAVAQVLDGFLGTRGAARLRANLQTLAGALDRLGH
jgi:hypothetical protein